MNITLQYKYIMHDVDQWTFRLAKVRIDDEEIRNEAQSSSVATDVSFYRRKIVEAIAQLKSMLKNRLSGKTGTGSDTLSTTDTSWTISLHDGAFMCDAQSITDLMHKYVVRSVVTEWAVTYAPDAAASVSQEVEALKQQILTEVYTRRYPELGDHLTGSYTITVTSANSNQGTVAGGGTYGYGTELYITATPKDGYHFVKWNDDNTNDTRKIVVTSTATYTATFAAN